MVVIRGQVEVLLSKIEVGVEVEVTETSVAFKNSDPGLAIISEMGHNKGSHTSPIAQFFLTLFKGPLTPPPRFEHVCCQYL